jgi:hypothetical protein
MVSIQIVANLMGNKHSFGDDSTNSSDFIHTGVVPISAAEYIGIVGTANCASVIVLPVEEMSKVTIQVWLEPYIFSEFTQKIVVATACSCGRRYKIRNAASNTLHDDGLDLDLDTMDFIELAGLSHNGLDPGNSISCTSLIDTAKGSISIHIQLNNIKDTKRAVTGSLLGGSEVAADAWNWNTFISECCYQSIVNVLFINSHKGTISKGEDIQVDTTAIALSSLGSR